MPRPALKIHADGDRIEPSEQVEKIGKGQALRASRASGSKLCVCGSAVLSEP
jgi:hypothetical protein